jgi:hypothetical protein
MKINQKLIIDVAQKLDDIIPVDKWITGVAGKIGETVDGYIFKAALHGMNNVYGDKIPDSYNDDIEAVLTAFVTDDYSEIDDLIVSRVNEAIDIPFIDEEDEGTILAMIVDIILELVKRRGGFVQVG